MTSTLDAARAHARSQAGATAASGPVVPPSPGLVWEETIASGGYASRVLRRGTVLRIEDIDGDACVQLLAHAAANPAERLNVADTVKVQWQAYLGSGAVLLSDMGRVLLTLVDDTSARHDCLCGTTNRRTTGSASSATPSGRDLLVLAGAKHGLGRVDIGIPVNLFKSVRVADDGALTPDGEVRPGTAVELRAEQDVLVLLANTPHPLDDRPYTGSTVRCTAWVADRPVDDPLRTSTPERERAFLNTDEAIR